MPPTIRRIAPVLTVFLAAPVGCGAQSAATATGYPRVYEYTYEFNTPSLVENHYIVLDSVEGAIRGWYYGTTDDFDSAREGYQPGFFVAPMEDLRISGNSISFTLRPRELFASPVPVRYRDAATVPRALLGTWTGPTVDPASSYSGTVTAQRISLDTQREQRVFRRLESGT
jgi:hypothetical protein